MTMLQAVGKCLRKYAKFEGRASRSEFWWFTLLAFLCEWPLLLTYGGDRTTRFLGFIYFTLTLLVLIPHAAVWTRRMHDVDKRGWSWLWIFIPLVGWFIIFRRLVRSGNPDANRFGDPDNGPKTPKSIRTKIDPEELKSEPEESKTLEDMTSGEEEVEIRELSNQSTMQRDGA